MRAFDNVLVERDEAIAGAVQTYPRLSSGRTNRFPTNPSDIPRASKLDQSEPDTQLGDLMVHTFEERRNFRTPEGAEHRVDQLGISCEQFGQTLVVAGILNIPESGQHLGGIVHDVETRQSTPVTSESERRQ